MKSENRDRSFNKLRKKRIQRLHRTKIILGKRMEEMVIISLYFTLSFASFGFFLINPLLGILSFALLTFILTRQTQYRYNDPKIPISLPYYIGDECKEKLCKFTERLPQQLKIVDFDICNLCYLAIDTSKSKIIIKMEELQNDFFLE